MPAREASRPGSRRACRRPQDRRFGPKVPFDWRAAWVIVRTMGANRKTSGRNAYGGKGRARWRPAASVGLAALLAALAPTSVHAEELSFGYQLAWGHLKLADAEVSYRESGSHYHLVSSGRTSGFLELFFSWQGRAETKGLLQEDGRRPLVHRHEGTWEEKSRWTQVDWNGTAVPKTEAEPPPDLEVVTPVPDASVAGTSDPFTVLLSVLDSLAATGRCDAEAKIWDGRRRYDLSVTHLGEETLTADRPWAYEGDAVACALDFERIGGFWREAASWREPDETAPQRRVVWAAEAAPGRWVLVRAEMETRYGSVVARLLPEDGLESEPEAPAPRGSLQRSRENL